MRGEDQPRCAGQLVYDRFTPTCVGKTRCVCLLAIACPGSPPHAWGRRMRLNMLDVFMRFTPTCVGKTPCRPLCASHGAVHPHMRGEDSRSSFWYLSLYGSPPHAWGRLAVLSVVSVRSRFTPTCVGKTCATSWPTCRRSVHPHMRGEDSWLSRYNLISDRFTPTCVGKTTAPRPYPPQQPVHPHMRGEDPRNVNWRSNFFGPQLFFVGLARCL